MHYMLCAYCKKAMFVLVPLFGPTLIEVVRHSVELSVQHATHTTPDQLTRGQSRSCEGKQQQHLHLYTVNVGGLYD